jgi:hypothetical protein
MKILKASLRIVFALICFFAQILRDVTKLVFWPYYTAYILFGVVRERW